MDLETPQGWKIRKERSEAGVSRGGWEFAQENGEHLLSKQKYLKKPDLSQT